VQEGETREARAGQKSVRLYAVVEGAAAGIGHHSGRCPQPKVLKLLSFTTAARAGRALRLVGDAVLFKVITDQLPDHLRRCQILSRAQLFKRCLFHRVDQNCESSAFRFHGSKQK
jgi:hypothetical protein